MHSMSRSEQDLTENQFPVIDPVYFVTQSEPALYDLFVQGGKNGIPAEKAKHLYDISTLALSTRESKFKKDLKHLREILKEHYGHEIRNKVSHTRGMGGQQAHYVLQII